MVGEAEYRIEYRVSVFILSNYLYKNPYINFLCFYDLVLLPNISSLRFHVGSVLGRVQSGLDGEDGFCLDSHVLDDPGRHDGQLGPGVGRAVVRPGPGDVVSGPRHVETQGSVGVTVDG